MLRSHTDPTPVCNAERLCGITHRGRHSETRQWRCIADRSSNCSNWSGANVGMPVVDDVTRPDRRKRLSPVRRAFFFRGDQPRKPRIVSGLILDYIIRGEEIRATGRQLTISYLIYIISCNVIYKTKREIKS